MPDFSSQQFSSVGPSGVLSVAGEGTPVGDAILSLGSTQTTAAVWPTALRAIYLPIMVPFPLTVYKMAWANGATVAGNVDVGIYDVNGARLVSTGMVAMAGVSVLQVADIADTALLPGNYFLAMNSDSATATFSRSSSVEGVTGRACGMQQEAIVSPGTLPATSTPAIFTSPFVPLLVAVYASAVF